MPGFQDDKEAIEYEVEKKREHEAIMHQVGSIRVVTLQLANCVHCSRIATSKL